MNIVRRADIAARASMVMAWALAAVSMLAAPAFGAAAKADAVKTAGKGPSKVEPPVATPTKLPEGAGHVIALPLLKNAARPMLNLAGEPWKRAACVTGFYESGGTKPAGHPTWVYLYYDPTAIWVAFRCEGQVGSDLKKEIETRDGKVWRDDSVEILVDPSGTCRNYFYFVVNSGGNLYDAFGMEEGWSAKLTIKTAVDDKGWSAMIGLPFAALKARPPQTGEAWAVNFYRNVSVKKEEATTEMPFVKVHTSWVPAPVNIATAKQFGYLLFNADGPGAARMRLVNPLVIGKNSMVFDPQAGMQYSLTGKTSDGEVAFKTPPQSAEAGAISFVLADDRARKIEVTLQDKQNRLLARGTYPMLSPEVSARVKALPALVQSIQAALPKFSEQARLHAQKLLAEIKPQLDQAVRTAADPGRRGPSEWEQLNKTVTTLELKLDDAACLARTLQKLPQADFAVGLEGPMRKVMIRDFTFTGWFDDHYDLVLARNEHEGFQLAVMPFERDLKNVAVSVSPLKASDGGAMAGGKVEVSLIGHVDVADEPPYKDIEYHGWYPDPLLSFQKSCEANAGDNVAFWIDVATGKDTPAGRYEAKVAISADGCRPVTLKLNVTVWDFVLPDGTHLRNAFTYHEHAVGRFYGDRWDDQMRHKYYDFILDHRLGIDQLYRGDRPDIEVIKYGVARGMNAFNVGSEFRNAAANNKRSKGLDDYIAQLKKENLFRYAYVYGYDEAKEEKFAEIRQVFGRAHIMFPGLKTMTTAADPSFGKRTRLRTAVDIWVPTTDSYNLEEARRLRKEGKDMWWYVCLGVYHPYADFFIEYPTIESRLLTGAMSYKYEAGGFLYYMINLWYSNKKVVGPGPYTDWDPGSCDDSRGKTANGDGSLMCPGPEGPLSTIRMENIRDGFEDYEYLYRLRELADAVRKQGTSAAGQSFLAEADKLLAVPDNVLDSVVEYTTDPQDLSKYRCELAAAILEGQKLAGTTGGQ